MDESRKVKYIIFGGVALLLLIVVLLFVRGCSNMKKEQQTKPSVESISTSVRDNTQAADIADVISNSIVGTDIINPALVSNEVAISQMQEQQDAERVQAALREQFNNRVGSDKDSDVTESRETASKQESNAQSPGEHTAQIEQTKEKITEQTKAFVPEAPASVESDVSEEPEKKRRFFSGENRPNSLPYLEVFGEQRIKTGDRIKLIAPTEMRVNNVTVPKGTIVYGRVTINERVNINVMNVSINGRMYAFNKNLLDNDGVPGINIGEAQDENEAQETLRKGEEIVNAVSVGGGVAGSVIRTVGNSISVLFGKNKSEIEIIVQGNYKLYIQ